MRVNLSHRLQIALVTTAITGVVLGALFAAIAFFARQDVYGDKRTELRAIMRSFTPPEDSSFDLEEFHAAHPELSASVYDSKGLLLSHAGNAPPPHVLGFRLVDERLVLGTPFQNQDIGISLSLRETDRGLTLLTEALIALWFPLTLLVGGVTWAAAQSVFRPLERLSAQALTMSGTDLSARLVTPDRAEFGAFARRLNEMLERIEETFQRSERFSTDAAHELRTPLAILRMRLETTLARTRTPEEYETALRRSVEEIERLTAITEALLRSARGETKRADAIDLAPVVGEAWRRWAERFAERGVRLEETSSPRGAVLLPDEARILIDNLLDNALRYAPEGSTVTLSLEEIGGEVRLAVRDEGPGVPLDLGERIFERLVRADDSRNRASGGAGIGLSVCRQIVMGRGGRMTLERGLAGGVAIGFALPSIPVEAKARA